MFVFPIRTDRRLQHTPWVNYALIAANVLIFLWTRDVAREQVADRYNLLPYDATDFQFITYQFLHADVWHLLGNMLFLYVFGNSVEDRLGKVGYLSFYLAGGVLAGLGHCLTSNNPVLGASGAVAAVTGAYMVLFPLSNVTLFYWIFYYVDTFEVSSLVLILFQIGQNVVMHLLDVGGVAYFAHLSGYAFGIAIAAALMWLRILPREPYDLLALLEQRRRRTQFRQLTKRGYHPWDHTGASGIPASNKSTTLTEKDQQIIQFRQTISEALARHDLPAAAGSYVQLLDADPGQVLSQQQQLDVANQLMSEGRYDHAARAYELFLNTFRTYPQREQVELILGLIYAKYLERRQRARELLTSALARLHNREQKELAQRMLDDIEA